MHILTIGLNHETAPVELRERLAFSEDRLDYALRTLRDMKSIMECVILSTCNRMELYVVCDQLHTGEYYAKTFIENWFRIPKEEFCDYLYVKKNEDAVRHLFHVVCGMNSLVLGETQILGQVKQAFFTAMESKQPERYSIHCLNRPSRLENAFIQKPRSDKMPYPSVMLLWNWARKCLTPLRIKRFFWSVRGK